MATSPSPAQLSPARTSRWSLRGASWLYPLKGIYYFAAHPFLWPLLKARLLPCLILSVVVLSILFTFTYFPQVAFLAIFQGRSAFFNGAFLVLGEGAVIIALLFEAFFVDETQVDVFDAVLINEGHLDLVAPSREIDEHRSDPVQKLGRPITAAQYAPFSLRLAIEWVLFLPLNLIPAVGTPAFIILSGRSLGPFHHWRYFKLLGYSRKERKTYIRMNRMRYTWFGSVALLLQLVPVLSMLFLLTTAAGSALWAVKLQEDGHDAQVEAEIHGTEQYTDEPAASA